MTLPELIAEIESGPLAAQLAPHWANEFQAPRGARPAEKERQGAFDVKTARAGRIHPDAAFHIHRILTTSVDGQPSRSDVLGWGSWTWKQVKYAKLETLKGRR